MAKIFSASAGWRVILEDTQGKRIIRRSIVAWDLDSSGRVNPIYLQTSTGGMLDPRWMPVATVAPDGVVEEIDGPRSWPNFDEFEGDRMFA